MKVKTSNSSILFNYIEPCIKTKYFTQDAWNCSILHQTLIVAKKGKLGKLRHASEMEKPL